MLFDLIGNQIDLISLLINNSIRVDVSTAFTFGLCLPTVCSLDFLQNCIQFNETINEIVSFKLRSETCQLEEIPSEWRTIDFVTM